MEKELSPMLPCYPATLLPCCPAAPLPCYFAAYATDPLPCKIDPLPSYPATLRTCPQCYPATLRTCSQSRRNCPPSRRTGNRAAGQQGSRSILQDRPQEHSMIFRFLLPTSPHENALHSTSDLREILLERRANGNRQELRARCNEQRATSSKTRIDQRINPSTSSEC